MTRSLRSVGSPPVKVSWGMPALRHFSITASHWSVSSSAVAPRGLVGRVTVQAFLVAVPRAVLAHGTDQQVHAVGGVHPGGILAQRKRLYLQRRGLPPGHGEQAVQQYLQIAFDLYSGGAAVNAAGGGRSLGDHGRPGPGRQFLAAVVLQRFDQVGQQDGPADVQRQQVLPVEQRHKGRVPVRVTAGDQVECAPRRGRRGPASHAARGTDDRAERRVPHSSDISSGKIPPHIIKMFQLSESIA